MKHTHETSPLASTSVTGFHGEHPAKPGAAQEARGCEPVLSSLPRQLAAQISHKSIQMAAIKHGAEEKGEGGLPFLGMPLQVKEQKQIARYIAESICDDMSLAGLGTHHMIYVASQIISTLSDRFRKQE